MLLSLNIQDFVIVSQLSLDCRDGLTVLSGETGAGKSILIDALSLCMGDRSDAGFVREGADAARITAVFDPPQAARDLLAANDLPTEELIIRRTVYRNGKSRALVNETPVTAALLKALADCLIDIHGQHAFQSLVRADEQRRLLDTHAGLNAEAAAVRDAWRVFKACESEFLAARDAQEQLSAEREKLAWQLEEIDRIHPAPGEWDILCTQHQRLSHAAELLDGVQAAIQELDEADDALSGRLSAVSLRLSQLGRRDSELDAFARQVDAAAIELQEAARGLSGWLRKADLDPDSLGEIDARMSHWHAVSRKLRIAPDALAEKAQTIRDRLAELDRQVDLDHLAHQKNAAEGLFLEKADRLRLRRQAAARELSDAITAAMQGLNLTGGRFVCEVANGAPHLHGTDTVQFLVAGHAGSTPRALAKVASGGELARISLAITVITSQASTIPTLIFDEVDSGIGGAVAETVGRYLRELAQNRQVLCVTHLPQVAAQGHHHWQVSKQFDGAMTQSRIRALARAERIQELARMLGGQTITDTTLAAAEELLATDAQQRHAKKRKAAG